MYHYYDREAETMSRDRLTALQSERLAACVKRNYENVPMYRERFRQLGIEPGDIRSIQDITKLPFTCKQDLRDNYPYGLLPLLIKKGYGDNEISFCSYSFHPPPRAL